jgi:hypothetical protein
MFEIDLGVSVLWQPCLLTDLDKMCNLYRGPSIDADDDDRRQTIDDGRQVMAKAHIAFGKVS